MVGYSERMWVLPLESSSAVYLAEYLGNCSADPMAAWSDPM